jgi:hypothetical protein
VKADLAGRAPLEVLDHVAEVHGGAVDAGLEERAIEQPAGRPDEGATGLVLVIAGYLSQEHEGSRDRSLAEHGLRRTRVEVAALTSGCLAAKTIDFGAQTDPSHDAVNTRNGAK